MYLCARACILVQRLCSASHGQCTYLPVVVLVLVSARVMYLLARGRTRTGTSCAVLRLDSTGYVPMCPCLHPCTVVLGNLSYVRILVFGLSRCTCSATPTEMDSLLVMSRDDFYIRCICAGCLYLTCRGAVVRLPVCTADREGVWQPRLIYTMYIIHHVFFVFFR